MTDKKFRLDRAESLAEVADNWGMSETTSPIDRSSVATRPGAQILKCYSAGGLKRFNRNTGVTVPLELLTTSSSQSHEVVNAEQMASVSAGGVAIPDRPAPLTDTLAASESVREATPAATIQPGSSSHCDSDASMATS